MTPVMVEQIDHYWHLHRLGNRSETIRKLLEIGLSSRVVAPDRVVAIIRNASVPVPPKDTVINLVINSRPSQRARLEGLGTAYRVAGCRSSRIIQ